MCDSNPNDASNNTDTLLFYRGISHIQKCPNRYPYLYEARPYNTLYGPYMSSKPFPYTNRPRVEYPTCTGGYQPYTNILDYCRLRKGELDNMEWWNTGTGYIY